MEFHKPVGDVMVGVPLAEVHLQNPFNFTSQSRSPPVELQGCGRKSTISRPS